MPAAKQPKKVPDKFLPRTGEHDDSQLPYLMMDALIANYHTDLVEANIAIFYRYGWRKDRDGRLELGDVKIYSDSDRQLHPYDVKLLINYEYWHNAETNDDQRRALLDDILSYPRPVMDEELGEPKTNEMARIVYYKRRPEIEGFRAVYERNGLWKADLEDIARVMKDAWEAQQRVRTEAAARAERERSELEAGEVPPEPSFEGGESEVEVTGPDGGPVSEYVPGLSASVS